MRQTLLTLALISFPAQAMVIPLLATEGDPLAAWEEHSFAGHTRYQAQPSPAGPVIEAYSDGTASALFRRIRIDLEQTPYLNWSWQIEQALPRLDETRKQGDDYSARVYVIHQPSSWMPWKTRAINYVWSSSQPVGEDWPNAFTERSHMVALRNHLDATGVLHDERRNIRDDFEHYFGKKIRYIDVIAIMTDTDNSGLRTRARYSKLFFSSGKRTASGI